MDLCYKGPKVTLEGHISLYNKKQARQNRNRVPSMYLAFFRLTVTRIKQELSENGWAELKILSLSIIPHLSSLK